MSIKKCTKCGVDKALTEFSKGKTCKPCRAKKERDRREANVSVYKNPTYKKCNHCDEVKAFSEFRKKSDTRDGYQPNCRDCANRICKANRPQYKARIDATYRVWCTANRDKRTATSAKRRAKKLQATPSWADHEAISAVYSEAQRLQALLGVPLHVDHVVPLQGELVCGLHVETNLQIIPATLNRKKSNKFKVQ